MQIAPAVRVGLGECFGLKPGEITTGRIVAALKHLGFDQIYDTSFAADLTVIEEGTEFLERKTQGGTLPMFTSCCPGWVKYAEQYFPELLPNLSTCRSPQAMFGSLRQGDASRSAQDRAQGSQGRRHHAMHGQEVRSAAPGDGRQWRSGRGSCADHAGTGADDPVRRPHLRHAAAGILRYALRLLHRRRSDLRQLRRRDGSGSALCRGKGDRQEAGAG